MSKKLEYRNLLESYDWQAKRQRIIDGAHGICQWCGKVTKDFNVHHKEYDSFHPAGTSDDKLVAICRSCHDNHHWNLRLIEYEKAKKEHILRHGFISEKCHQQLIELHGV